MYEKQISLPKKLILAKFKGYKDDLFLTELTLELSFLTISMC